MGHGTNGTVVTSEVEDSRRIIHEFLTVGCDSRRNGMRLIDVAFSQRGDDTDETVVEPSSLFLISSWVVLTQLADHFSI